MVGSTLKPRDAKTEAQRMKLRTDNHGVAAGWILLNGENKVVLRTQRAEQEATGRVEFTHREFNALVDWWNREQKVRG